MALSFFGEVFVGAYGENVDPNIYERFPDQNDILPIGDFAITYEIDDTTSGINTSSENLILQKWDGVSAWGTDIASTYVVTKNITTTLATYTISDLPYGKYRNTFSINDNDVNNTTVSTVFYIDEPEFTISTPEINIGDLESGVSEFSPDELVVTIKTVGVGFKLDMLKNTNLDLDGSNSITDFNGTTGFGYDSLPYSSTITALGSSINLATQTGSINVNGGKNTYTYKLRYGALINTEDFAGGEYEASLDFDISFDYSDSDNRCWLDGVTTLSCNL
ncbi:hypothetical protein N9J72_01105 [Candidatus Gracilibacteria bacterium]|nr:hypothetical protein [Candidatus Gracilibacteria bacterium]